MIFDSSARSSRQPIMTALNRKAEKISGKVAVQPEREDRLLECACTAQFNNMIHTVPVCELAEFVGLVRMRMMIDRDESAERTGA